MLRNRRLRRGMALILVVLGAILLYLAPNDLTGIIILLAGVAVEVAGIALERNS